MTAEASSATARPVAIPQTVPQRPAKPQGVPQSQPAPVVFAGLVLIEDDDLQAELDDFAGQGNEEWRIERRYRRRKGDGAIVMYWNYRRRKVSRNDEGRRRIEYRKGGSRIT